MKKTSTKKNFENLVSALEKYLLDSQYACHLRKNYFSKKYNAYISERAPYLFLDWPQHQYFQLMNRYRNNEISKDVFDLEFKELKTQYGNAYKKMRHKLRLFVYLDTNKFCVDISDNDVRTKLLEIDLPEQVSCSHTNTVVIAFENTIKNQLRKYIYQPHSNIEILKTYGSGDIFNI